MLKKIISVLKYILFLAIGVGLLALAFKGININKTFAEIKNANLLWLGLAVLLSIVAFVTRAYRWNLMIEPLGFKPSLINTTAAVCFGYLANLAVPRLGEVSRCGSLSRVEKIPFEKLLGTVIAERIIDVITLLVAMVIMILTQLDKVKGFINIYDESKKIGGGGQSPITWIILGIIVLAVIVLIYLFIASPSSKIVIRIRSLFKGMIEGVRSVGSIKNLPLFIFFSILTWTLYYLTAYFSFFALSATSDLGLQAALVVLVAGGIGMAAPVQGGFGVYHFLVSQSLYMIYSISTDHGISYATMVHSSQVLVIIVLGIAGYLILSFSKGKETSINSASAITRDNSAFTNH